MLSKHLSSIILVSCLSFLFLLSKLAKAINVKHDCNHGLVSCVIVKLYPGQNQVGGAWIPQENGVVIALLGSASDGDDSYFAVPDTSNVYFYCITDPNQPNPSTGHVVFTNGIGNVIAKDTPSAKDANFLWKWRKTGYEYQAKYQHENLIVYCNKN